MLIILTLLAPKSWCQVNFSMTFSLCEGNTATATASTGTFSASSYTWSANPPGAVFSASSSPHTGITFPGPGIYTITIAAFSGTATGSASNTIVVHPNPVVNLTSSSPSICSGQDATLTASGASNYSWEPQADVFIISATAGYVSPNVTTVFTVSGTSSVGCVGSKSYTLHVGTYPNLGFSATSQTVCAGFASTITAFGANTYTWTGTTFTGTAHQPTIAVGPGSYSLIGSNGGNCSDSADIIIGMAPPLTVTAVSSRSTVCFNSEHPEVAVVLSASGAGTYVWAPYIPGQMSYSLGPTTAVTPSVSTCYTLVGSTSICSVSVLVCVTVLTCTSADGSSLEKRSFTLFPNPVKDKLSLRSDSRVSIVVEITDLFGKRITVHEKRFDGVTSQDFYVGTIPPGIYVMKIWPAGEDPQVIRFIKE